MKFHAYPRTKDTQRKSGLTLHLALLLAILTLTVSAAPKAYADTLPTPCVTTNANCPLITNGPAEINYAGDEANITGLRFGSDVTVWSELIDSTGAITSGSKKQLTVTFANSALLQVKPPSNATARQLFAFYVERVTGGVTYDSAVMFVNSPTINKISETTVRPGSTLYIWGRWLSQMNNSTANTKVYFHPTAGGTDIAATINTGDVLQLQVTVPALTNGATYQLKITNGWGGTTYGETTFSKTLTAYATANGNTDPFNLGVYWGSDLVPVASHVYDITSVSSGLPSPWAAGQTTDASTAIQADLNWIGTHGGGVLSFPAGTYVVGHQLQILYSNLVMQGAGASSTTITYGTNSTLQDGFVAFAENSITATGVSKMTITNAFPSQTTSPTANGTVSIYSNKTGINRLFLADMVINMGQSYGLSLGSATDVVVTRSTINHDRNVNNPSGHSNGPIAAGSDNFTFTHNTVNYKMGRLHFTGTDHQWVMSNTITIDGSVSNLTALKTGSLETGGIEFSFSDDVAYIGNTIQISPLPDFSTLDPTVASFMGGCFEMIMSQWSQYGMSDYGKVTGVSGTVISDSSKSWTASNLTVPAPYAAHPVFIAITDGVGLGQVRTVVSHTANSVTIDSPFDVPPTANASYYTISYFVNDTFVAQDNTIRDGQVGIEIYSGGINSSIRRNKIYGSHGIRLYASDQQECYSTANGGCAKNEYYVRSLNWHANLAVNTLDNSGSPANWPEGLFLHLQQNELNAGYNFGLHGNSFFDVELRANAVTAHNPNISQVNNTHDSDGWFYIAAWTSDIHGTEASTQNADGTLPLIGILGVVMDQNSSTGWLGGTTPLEVGANGTAGIVTANNSF